MQNRNPIGVDLGLLCQVIGRRLGVEVVEDPSATTFATDGKKVIIPTSIAGGEIDADIMRGGMAHEAAGHVLHTDFAAVKKYMEEMQKTAPTGMGLAKALENIIEDARIEQAAIRKYPGCRKMLYKMIEALEQRGFFRLPEDETPDPAAVLCAWLIRVLRVNVMKQPLALDAVVPMAEKAFGKNALDAIYAVAEAGARSGSTTEVLEAVDKIRAILGEAANPPPEEPQPQPEQNQGGEQGDQQESGGGNGQSGQEESQPGDGQGESGQPQPGDGQGDQQAGDGGADQAQPGNGQGADQSGQPGGQSSAGSNAGKEGGQGQTPGKQPVAGNQAQQEAAQKALSATADECGKTDIGEMIGDAVKGMGAGRGRTNSVGRRDLRRAASMKPSPTATSLTARLRGQLEEALRAKVEDEDPELSEVGRLNHRMLPRAAVGDRHIFLMDGEDAPGLSTAVYLLVDCSSSMDNGGGGRKGTDEAALDVLYAMSTAMAAYETQGVKFALSAFNGSVHDLKGFNDPWVKAKGWIGHYRATGGTMATESMRMVLPDLMVRKEDRKILYVVTDGDIGREDENRKICNAARKENVEIVVLCIGGNQGSVSRGHGFEAVQQVEGSDLLGMQKAIFNTLRRTV